MSKINKKNRKRNRVKQNKRVKEHKEKLNKSNAFDHNGLKYHRSDDTVLLKIIDSKDGEYMGIELGRDGNSILMNRVMKTTEDKAFIFMLSKKVFEKSSLTNTLDMLKKENLSLKEFSGEYTYQIV